MVRKCTHVQVIPEQICHYGHARKTNRLFLLCDTGFDFTSRNIFANLGFFKTVFISVQSIIPWFKIYHDSLESQYLY